MTKAADALTEAMLIAKQQRERADAAERNVVALEERVTRLVTEISKALMETEGDKFVIRQNNYELRRLRTSVKELQDDLNPSTPTKVEVISFIDGSGHGVIINCTGAAQKLKVMREIVRAAIHHGHIRPDDESFKKHYDVPALLASGTADELGTLLHDADIPMNGMSREGLSPIGASNEWKLEWGFDD